MRTRPQRSATAVAIMLTLALAACGAGATGAGSSSGAASVGGKIGVILPDTASSSRWESADRAFLVSAFQGAGVESDIRNADGDTVKFRQIADSMLDEGVNVLMMANLDSTTGASVIRKAAAAGVPVIDYDRLTLAGGAKYYVSFDNVNVGRAMGEGLVAGLRAQGKRTGRVLELNGSPTDNNAALFRQGYDEVIRRAGYTVIDSQPVPDWDNTKAVTIFEQMFAQAGHDVDGVAAANDGLAGAAISVLRANGLAGKVPVTGQDATDEGLQRILTGTQYVSVYKAIRLEAQAAARLAIALVHGDTVAADRLAAATLRDPDTGVYIKAVLLPPKPIFKPSVKDVVGDRYTTTARICTTAQLKAACAVNGVR
ncbi:MAG TPA: substrate-binding domain-containing protein [Kineosporiaceae bacterium]